MKGIVLLTGILVMLILACSKKNVISPIHGTINGNPATTLYGSSNKPTDYVLIDTMATVRKISYDGIVFTYIYSSATGIYIMGSSVPAAKGTLSISDTKTVLTITAAYTITFGSDTYTSN